MASAPSLKPLSMAGGCLNSLSTISFAKNHRSLLFSRKPVRTLNLSSFSILSLAIGRPAISLVAKSSDWALEEEESQVGIADMKRAGMLGDDGDDVFADDEEEDDGGVLTEGRFRDGEGFSDWEGEEDGEEEEFDGGEGFAEEGEDERRVVAEREFQGEKFTRGLQESYGGLSDDAKVYVGNLPLDIDSGSLAHVFEKVGVVQVSEVIYNRETERSRGFAFVTMSTAEEAQRAVEQFHGYNLNGKLLSVNKATPRGSRPVRAFEPSFSVFIGNVSWNIDDAQLARIFSEYGKVVSARVVCDRETGASRGFGFVRMSTQEEMENAISGLDGQVIDGRTVRVNVAEDRPKAFSSNRIL